MTTISKLNNVAAAAGGLTLTDRTVTGTVPAFNTGGSGGGAGSAAAAVGGGGTGGGGFTGGGTSTFSTNSFTVNGVDIANGELGPLSTGTVSSGRTFTTADSAKDVALVDASYATTKKLKVGCTIAVGNSKGDGDQLHGRRHRERAGGRQPVGRLHPARRRADPRQPEERRQHDLRVGDQRRRDHHGGERDQARRSPARP